MADNKISQEQLLALIYDKLIDLDIRTTLIDANLQSLQQDVSHFTYVRSEHFKLRYNHKTNELYITEFFKIPFTGNEAVLLGYLFKKANGLPKKSTKFYPAELAGSFSNVTDGLKTKKAILMILGIAALSYLDRDSEPDIISCDTNLNPTPCPEPDYDEELYETLKQYPDDSY